MNNPADILKFLSNSSSPIEDQKVIEWLNDNQENNTLLREYEGILKGLESIKDYKSFDVASEWGNFKTNADWDSSWTFGQDEPVLEEKAKVVSISPVEPPKKKLGRRSIMSIAAAFIVLIAATWFLFPSEPEFETFVTLDSIEEHVLADGTMVTLHENSTLTAPTSFDKFDERRVEADGKVVFDVSEDPVKPFIVDTRNTEVKVLGTIFVVENVGEEIVLENIEGKVKFYEKGNEETGVILNQGDKIKFSTSNGFEDMNYVPEPVVEVPIAKPTPNLGTSFNHGYIIEKIMLKSDYKIMPSTDLEYNPSERVYVNMDQDLDAILKELKTKTTLELKEKDCEGCFEIVSFSKK